jgi:hypothetical protein
LFLDRRRREAAAEILVGMVPMMAQPTQQFLHAVTPGWLISAAPVAL